MTPDDFRFLASAFTEAERIALASEVVPHEALASRVVALVVRFASGPPVALLALCFASGPLVALRLPKLMEMDGLSRSYREHVLAQDDSALANRLIANHDIEDGVTAFREKREPEFRGLIAPRRWQGN